MKNDLTLAKLKNTDFFTLYNKFIIGTELSANEYECILAIAVCLLNAEDEVIKKLGYRIIVDYCNQKGQYSPLYEIAINQGLFPVSKYINMHYIQESEKNFFTEWNDSFTEQYKVSDTAYQSEEQNEMVNTYEKEEHSSISIVAPTSYGKSELILRTVNALQDKNLCVITSTKALLMQTKQRVKKTMGTNQRKIIVHPEMYDHHERPILAILTQERLLRLLKKDPTLSFDCIVVDEAHELLDGEQRSSILASVLIIAQKRNPEVIYKYLTPFLADSSNLKTKFNPTDYELKDFRIKEYIKTEKYIVIDTENGKISFYDQFANAFIEKEAEERYTNEERIVNSFSAGKNIIYLNKPVDIENFALSLADNLPDVRSDRVDKAIENISTYLKPEYNLLKCLRKGIIYHHGSVPDSIRIYIEDLYRSDPAIKYVITSSTLLSGVNLPAERMFILDNRKGRTQLSYNSFQNLVGRVCRFSSVFDCNDGSMKRLEPHIFIVKGRFCRKGTNIVSFVRKVAKADITPKDEVENVLLKNVDDNGKQKEVEKATEFIENYEKDTIPNYHFRYTTTSAGKSCIMNGITEIDIFAYEQQIQEAVDKYMETDGTIDNPDDLLKAINSLFIRFITDPENILNRIKNDKEQAYYSMFFSWKIGNITYTEMIDQLIDFWRECYRADRNKFIFVGRWGNVALEWNATKKEYINLTQQNLQSITNLAIVRIKEGQDFIDNALMKFVEVLFDLELIDNAFYKKIKFGTDDETIICLIKNGLSLNTATLLFNKYQEYLSIDVENSMAKFDPELITEMEVENENQIVLYEVKNCL